MNIACKFLPLLLLLAAECSAEVGESLDYTYYPVNAQRGQAVRAALQAVTPIRENGQVFYGYTKWNVRWNFRWNENPDRSCKITSVNTSVSGTITLPQLAGGDDGQRATFDRYVTALKEHEIGHFRIGKSAAQAIDAQIMSLPAASSCASLEKNANDGAYALLEMYKQNERKYDVDTEHGRTQGARLDQ